MQVEVDEAGELITVNGRKFTFAFFDMLAKPVDETWLFRLREQGGSVTIERVEKLLGETLDRANAVH